MLPLLFVVLPAGDVEQYGYRVLDKKPQDPRLYVQGLEIHDDGLYVSGGLYGESSLERYAFDSMTLETARRLDARLFAEGLTVFGDHVYLLTWREQLMLIFNRKTLEPLGSLPIAGQGWGLTNDGERLIYSDGSDRLHFLAPQTRLVERSLKVTENGQPVHRLNELEWVEGEIWANIYQTDRVVVIDPTSGEVRASIDLSGLLPRVERKPDTSVLNGIARDPADGAIWVTGKRWPWLYRIELVPLERAAESTFPFSAGNPTLV